MQGFLSCKLPLLSIGDERAQVSDYLIHIAQKIPDWLIKFMFLGEVEASMRLGIKFKFSIMGFSINDTIWGL